MSGSSDAALNFVPVASLVAGAVAVILCLLAIGLLRRSLRRFTTQVRELRRHPRVGSFSPEAEPALGELASELNTLLESLREQITRATSRSEEVRSLSAGPPDLALIGIDGDWQVITFSRGAVALTGWQGDEILDRHVEALFAPGEWERILPKLSRRSVREAGISESVRLVRRDGREFPARLSAGPSGEDGATAGILLAVRDVSEEEQLDGKLRESEERYRRLVEGMSDGMFIVQDGLLVYSNPALARMIAIEPEALRDMPFKEIVDTRDVLRVAELLQEAEGGGAARGEIVCFLARRADRPIEARIAWACVDFRGRRGVIGTVADLTERARLQRAVVESENRLRATLEATGDGILVLGWRAGHAEVVIANPAFCRLFGGSRDEWVGASRDAAARALGERLADPGVAEALLSGGLQGEVRRDGVEIRKPAEGYADLIAGPVRPSGDPGVGVILMAREVTDRLQGERRVRESLEDLSRAKADLEVAYGDLASTQKTLAQRNEQLETVNAELKSLDEMKSNLLANVSHELHTPLVSIKGYTEMILKRKLGPLTPEQERGLLVALKNIDRLIEMIDNLLSFSRMENGETQLYLENVPLWQLIDEAIEMVGDRMKRKNVTLSTQYETDDLVVRGDRLKVVQVLTNLLTNAVKFNRDKGEIRIAARRGPKGFIEIDVADTGVGITTDEQKRIFERFYQIDSKPSRRYEGTGIGLSIVSDILRLHGCSIRVASDPGQGSVFTFTLPLARLEAPSRPRSAAGRRQTSG